MAAVWLEDALLKLARKSWGAKKRSAFYRRLAVYIDNGIPPRQAVKRLLAQIEGRYKNPDSFWATMDVDRLALTEIHDRLANGERFSQAIADWAPASELAILRAGEGSGELPDALRSVLAGSSLVAKVITRIVFSMVEPAVMSLLLLYLLYLIGTKMVPPIAQIAPPSTWPFLAKLMVPLGAMATSPIFYGVLLVLVLGTVAAFISLPRWAGRSRVWVENAPPWSIYRRLQGAQWMLAFSKLSRAGIPQSEALLLQSEMASPWMAERLRDAAIRVKNGSEIGKAFADGGYGFPDRVVADDMTAFSGSPDFPRLVEELAREWLAETESKIQGLVTVLTIGATLGVNGVFLIAVVGMTQLQNLLTAAAH
ncbi:Integral membrane protein [Acidithiobacillus caldus SM-1]|uniref:Integral membrane protein n=1 Tax=Acidithiobacillus caldus (strain SM-1) TaxID=990288 RepID=F9ZMR1_ACICS|nr:type II secretion system F family protein [Acidithiobacillus caldus]AEK57821.1 Integral membrane protein [Acidithiobacillus caldus SM-1]